MMAANSHDRSPAPSAPIASRFPAVVRILARNIFITLKVFTEFPETSQRLFSFALHKQQKLLMRKNACNLRSNGHLIWKADASYSLVEAHNKAGENV
jgi:hypothetical protein